MGAEPKFSLIPKEDEEHMLGGGKEPMPTVKRGGVESAASALERWRVSDQAAYDGLFPRGDAPPAAPPVQRPAQSAGRTAAELIARQNEARAPMIEAEAEATREAARTSGISTRTVGSARNGTQREIRTGVAPSRADWNAKRENPFDNGFFKRPEDRAGLQAMPRALRPGQIQGAGSNAPFRGSTGDEVAAFKAGPQPRFMDFPGQMFRSAVLPTGTPAGQHAYATLEPRPAMPVARPRAVTRPLPDIAAMQQRSVNDFMAANTVNGYPAPQAPAASIPRPRKPLMTQKAATIRRKPFGV